MFVLTVYRFSSPRLGLALQFASLTYAISTASSYHARSRWYEFTLYWFAYSALGGAVAYIIATLVLPITAGAWAAFVLSIREQGQGAPRRPSRGALSLAEALPPPTPPAAGTLVRRRLAAGLQHTCRVLRLSLELQAGEASPDTGLLLAASGETSERIGLDSGLYPLLLPLYAKAGTAGQTIQVGAGV